MSNPALLDIDALIKSSVNDKANGVFRYTLGFRGHRWTVELKPESLAQFGKDKKRRKEYLRRCFAGAMQGPPDQPPVAEQLDALNRQRADEFGRPPTPDNPLPLPHTGVGGDVIEAAP